MSTLTLTYAADRGYVRFAVTGVAASYTVKRRTDDGHLQVIAGFIDDSWLSGGAGFGEDYRPDIGETMTYVIAPIDADIDDPAYVRASIGIPGNQAWLRDVRSPVLSSQVIVVSTGDEQLPAFQNVYDISGRRLPLVVHDVREGRRGEVTLLAADRDNRAAIEALLATGNPLLLTMCSDLLWTPCMMAVGAATFTRFGTKDAWLLRLTYAEVDDPLVTPVRVASSTYSDIIAGQPSLPGDPSPVTYQWLRDSFVSYLSVVTGTRK